MKDLMIFEGNQVEIILNEKEEPLFEIYSTGMALGYITSAKGKIYPHKMRINKTIENAEISTVVRGVQQYMTEEQLYDFMLEAHTDKCKKFKKWITHEVLPKIRKTGGYLGNTKELSEEEIMAKAFMIAQKTIENQKKQLEEQKPKVIFADAVASSKDTILIRQLAKILNQNGIDMGEKRLYKWLRDNGYLIKQKGADYNTPTQRAMNLKLFEVKETNINTSDGTIIISKTTKVTGKGQIYFINKFKEVK